MNDPHVVWLQYDFKHDFADYSKAPPLTYETDAFAIHLENDVATVTLKDHFATLEEAREVVDVFMRTWEVIGGLAHSPESFAFQFAGGHTIDRTAGSATRQFHATVHSKVDAIIQVLRSSYPAPVPNVSRDDCVDVMFARYKRYRQKQTTLPDLANFCSTALRAASGKRQDAAKRFGISREVLRRLDDLAANKGGEDARKALAINAPYSADERKWLETLVPVLIRRAADVAFDPSTAEAQITMADLPPLPL